MRSPVTHSFYFLSTQPHIEVQKSKNTSMAYCPVCIERGEAAERVGFPPALIAERAEAPEGGSGSAAEGVEEEFVLVETRGASSVDGAPSGDSPAADALSSATSVRLGIAEGGGFRHWVGQAQVVASRASE